MITREQISMVLDHPVYDPNGDKVGEVKNVFLDDATGRPEWLCVKTGLFGTKRAFVPFKDADWVADHVEVPYEKAYVKDAPSVAPDDDGHLSPEQEHDLYSYYDLDWPTSLREDPPGLPLWDPAAESPVPAGEPATAGGEAGGLGPDGETRHREGGPAGERRVPYDDAYGTYGTYGGTGHGTDTGKGFGTDTPLDAHSGGPRPEDRHDALGTAARPDAYDDPYGAYTGAGTDASTNVSTDTGTQADTGTGTGTGTDAGIDSVPDTDASRDDRRDRDDWRDRDGWRGGAEGDAGSGRHAH
ncbi:PRC-barrel domain-containing protein [Microbispora sp. ATCC PTA-5024]|uniref:PRC-barrel domain-containing protein n=1 Tax=Microbispora sp. ATCC PTA-5024 TaxID=316330 RepID=UPI00041E63BB|nr:PRC-barrel domain-containing protein [Microbispora sp. ATCC PTA-5024]